VDDYHGRYRIWLAMAAASVLASIDLATGVNRLLRAALAPAARWCGVAEHWGFWTALGGIALYLAVRLILETRRAPLALLVFLLSAISLAFPMFLSQQIEIFDSPSHAVLFRSGAQLSGYFLLLTGTMLFARHVMLDVEGKVPDRKVKKRKAAAKKANAGKAVAAQGEVATPAPKAFPTPQQKAKAPVTIRNDLDSKPRPAPLAPKSTYALQRPVVSSHADVEDPEPQGDLRHLSRAERKRLKREAKLARRAA
jgi:hypothetical protein